MRLLGVLLHPLHIVQHEQDLPLVVCCCPWLHEVVTYWTHRVHIGSFTQCLTRKISAQYLNNQIHLSSQTLSDSSFHSFLLEHLFYQIYGVVLRIFTIVSTILAHCSKVIHYYASIRMAGLGEDQVS
jgi:hypothetical protein